MAGNPAILMFNRKRKALANDSLPSARLTDEFNDLCCSWQGSAYDQGVRRPKFPGWILFAKKWEMMENTTG
jgi:hypothetical protein